jgi:hypothetical protein
VFRWVRTRNTAYAALTSVISFKVLLSDRTRRLYEHRLARSTPQAGLHRQRSHRFLQFVWTFIILEVTCAQCRHWTANPSYTKMQHGVHSRELCKQCAGRVPSDSVRLLTETDEIFKIQSHSSQFTVLIYYFAILTATNLAHISFLKAVGFSLLWLKLR